MIIKSHIRGGYRSAAEYLKEQGQNEKIRLVEISDPEARNLDEAFQNMWVVASNTKCTKPLHHISINPMKGEYLTDVQVMAIVERCEEKYGYRMFHHQRVIVEHVKDGRQHFHVIWNRVSLVTGKAVWPGEHWKKSKQVCREMEKELGLRTPTPRRLKRGAGYRNNNRKKRKFKKYSARSVRSRTKHQRIKTKPLKGIKTKSPTKYGKTPRLKNVWVRPKSRGTNFDTFRLNPVSSILIKIVPKAYSTESARAAFEPTPFRPSGGGRKGWPLAAIIDWKAWGRRNPGSFFAKWPELGS